MCCQELGDTKRHRRDDTVNPSVQIVSTYRVRWRSGRRSQHQVCWGCQSSNQLSWSRQRHERGTTMEDRDETGSQSGHERDRLLRIALGWWLGHDENLKNKRARVHTVGGGMRFRLGLGSRH